ncbi:MAG: hypothetical protein LBH86_05665 [Oscillospiraceae bacterium]|jgi:uncharacterized integral membrane protein|nr:hypothetical protein [Oscillospiraceae bacterium]
MDLPFEPKPMGVGTILDHSFRIYRRNFGAVALFALLIGALSQVLVDLVLLSALPGGLSGPGLSNFFNEYLDLIGGGIDDYGSMVSMFNRWGSAVRSSSLLGLAVSLLITPMVTGGVTNVVSGYYHGVKDTAGGWFARARSHYGRFLLTGLVLLLSRILSGLVAILPMFFLLVIFGLVIGSTALSGSIVGVLVALPLMLVALAVLVAVSFMWTLLIFPAAINEGSFGFRAASRAFSLTFRNFWRMLGTTVLMYLIVFLVQTMFSVGLTSLVLLLNAPSGIASLASAPLGALVAPLVPIASSLMYLDARIRREGYDLYLRSHGLSSQYPQPPHTPL